MKMQPFAAANRPASSPPALPAAPALLLALLLLSTPSGASGKVV